MTIHLSAGYACDHCDEPIIESGADPGLSTYDRFGRRTHMHCACILSAIGAGWMEHALLIDEQGCMAHAAGQWRPLVEYFVRVNRMLNPTFGPSPAKLATLVHRHFHHESSYGLFLACSWYGA
jgi:hypothetical protein